MSELYNRAPGAEPDSRPAGRDEVIQATIKAAAELFAQNNPSQVSVREIAAKAGVSHALVHRYLGTKDDIFRQVLELDREQAAEFWMHDHGMNRTAATFAADLPPGRYVRTIMRAALENVPMTADSMRLPHSDRMIEMLRSAPLPPVSDDAGFDMRFLFAAVTALAASMSIAEEFFLAQARLEDCDRELLQAELNRLIRRMMLLGDPEAELC